MNPERLSRFMAYVLRHAPREHGLEPDDQGFVPLAALFAAAQRASRLAGVRLEDLVAVAAGASPRRFELRGDRIRALYGHSTQGAPEITYPPAVPPEILYHGTHRAALARIRRAGLQPMSRQYVHLSTSIERAREVGGRRRTPPIILRIRARRAHDAGPRFHEADARHWLVRAVPADFIEFPE
jgi:putative RNA 2'-phosphotransferase